MKILLLERTPLYRSLWHYFVILYHEPSGICCNFYAHYWKFVFKKELHALRSFVDIMLYIFFILNLMVFLRFFKNTIGSLFIKNNFTRRARSGQAGSLFYIILMVRKCQQKCISLFSDLLEDFRAVWLTSRVPVYSFGPTH